MLSPLLAETCDSSVINQIPPMKRGPSVTHKVAEGPIRLRPTFQKQLDSMSFDVLPSARTLLTFLTHEDFQLPSYKPLNHLNHFRSRGGFFKIWPRWGSRFLDTLCLFQFT
jgi:hypothetical protein